MAGIPVSPGKTKVSEEQQEVKPEASLTAERQSGRRCSASTWTSFLDEVDCLKGYNSSVTKTDICNQFYCILLS